MFRVPTCPRSCHQAWIDSPGQADWTLYTQGVDYRAKPAHGTLDHRDPRRSGRSGAGHSRSLPQPAAGPMACPTCGEDTNGLAVTNTAANTFTFNPIPPTNRSSQPVVLDSVALIKPSPGVHITRVAVSSKPVLYQLERGSLTPRLYPSTSLTDATGARIPPASGNPQRFSLVIFLAVPRSPWHLHNRRGHHRLPPRLNALPRQLSGGGPDLPRILGLLGRSGLRPSPHINQLPRAHCTRAVVERREAGSGAGRPSRQRRGGRGSPARRCHRSASR